MEITNNNKYLFALHGKWGVSDLDVAIQNNNKICKLLNIPIYNIYFNKYIQEEFKLFSFQDLINYHVKNIKALQIDGIYYFFGFCYAGIIASFVIIKLYVKK